MKKYATLSDKDSVAFNEITDILNKQGYEITQSKTRAIFSSSLEKIVKHVAKRQYGKVLTTAQAKEMVKNVNFQESIAPLIEIAYTE